MIYPELKDGDQQGGHCRCQRTVLQQGRTAVPALTAMMALFVWLTAVSGCVSTAECDEYVGCPDGAVCYQSQCLAQCDDDGDCDNGEVCTPCRGEDEDEGQDRCFGAEGNACVDASNDDD